MSVPQYESSRSPLEVPSPLDLTRLSNKSVIVTGGASGLGKAYAKALAAAGAFVTIGDIDVVGGTNVATEILESGKGKAQFIKCDVRSWEQQVALFEQATTKSPNKSCDIVIANAGIAGPDELFILEDPELQPTKPDLRLLDVNLTGVMYTAKLAMHFFRRQKLSPEYDRCLILKSSLAGYIDLPGAPIYNASKFGVRAIMRNLRWTAWQESTRVNVVAPWFVRTPLMTEGAMQHLESKGVDFAAEEDAVKTVLRIASDKTLNGRSLAVVPHSWDVEGYFDLDQDDFKDGDSLQKGQEQVLFASHRATIPLSV